MVSLAKFRQGSTSGQYQASAPVTFVLVAHMTAAPSPQVSPKHA